MKKISALFILIMELLGSCTADFIPSKKQHRKQRLQKPEPVGLSFHGNARDINMNDSSFHQQFYQCDWQNDQDNQNLMNRRFFNRGSTELTERPEFQNCGPTKVNLERNGDVTETSVDDKPTQAENLKDIGDESVLRGLWAPDSNCKVNKEIGPDCITENDIYCRMPNPSLSNNFNTTKVNDEFFQRQLAVGCEPSLTKPSIFRNNTRMKLQTP